MNSPSWKLIPETTRWGAYALAGLMAFLIWDQFYWWNTMDEYAFGFIVPFFVGFILYDRWPQIFRSTAGIQVEVREDNLMVHPEKHRWMDTIWFQRLFLALAGLMITGGLAAYTLGALYRGVEGQNLITSNLLAFGFANIVLGGIFYYSSKRTNGDRIPLNERLQITLLFLFPALIWMLSVPMFGFLQKIVSTFLMNKVAFIAFNFFDILGYAIIREDSILKLPLGDVGVEDACSGIRSLTACLFAGSFLGSAFFTSIWKKVFLVGTAMFFAFTNNILRSVFLTAWAYAKGPEGLDSHVILFGMDLGNVHDFTGWVVLGITVGCLLILVKLFSIQWEEPIKADSPEISVAK